MAYVSLAQAKAYNGINLTNVTDGQIIELLETATGMMNAYLNQSLILAPYTKTVEAITITSEYGFGGFQMQLPNAPVQAVQSLQINYGYGYQPIVMASGDYYLNGRLGILKTRFGNYTQANMTFGTTFDTQVHEAVVAYTAGYDIYGSGTANEIPSELIQAFWGIVRAYKPKFDLDISIATGISGDNFNLQPASNRVKQYRLPTENVMFDEDDPIFQPQTGKIISKWIEDILNRYRFAGATQGMANLY